MRQSIGSTWIFALVISFTLIFSGFLVLSMTYSSTYKAKNEMTTIIEKYQGITTSSNIGGYGSVELMNNYLYNSHYSDMGTCEIGDLAEDNLENPGQLEEVTDTKKKYYYCINYSRYTNGYTVFNITLFYKVNLPILKQLSTLTIKGSTNQIKNAYLYNEIIG